MNSSPKKHRLESYLQKQAIALIESMGGYVVKTHVSAYQSQGEPDLTVCYNGKYVAFELKKDEQEKAKKLQEYKLKKIREAGGIAKVVSSLDEIKEVLYELSRV